MDRERFDALTRLVWTNQSRRGVLGMLLGATSLVHTTVVAKPKPKAKRQRQRKRKQRSERRCFPGRSCLLGQGKDNAGCDFARSVAFFQRNAQGANLSHTNFTDAQMAEANFQGADLGGACLVGANLLEAVIDNSTSLKNAIFCHTLMPDGATNDSGCGKGTRCCPTPGPICRTCADDCLGSINDICNAFGTRRCCPGMGCAPTAYIFLTTCQAPCNTDQDCAPFGTGLKCCAGQALICPFFPGARCCAVPGPLTCE
jgi:hypothetical protein